MIFKYFCSIVILLTSASVCAQVRPACPTATGFFGFFHMNLGAPNPPDASAATGYRGYDQIDFIKYQYVPVNVVVSGFNITFDAPSEIRHTFQPVFPVSIGVLPAGAYAARIQPIARNVTPNVMCPVQNIPFTVSGALPYEYVPVSTLSPGVGFILALLIGFFSLGYLHQRGKNIDFFALP